MKYFFTTLSLLFLLTACGAPKATSSQLSSDRYDIAVTKSAQSIVDVIDVRLSDGEHFSNGFFKIKVTDGSGPLLSSKGVESFTISVMAKGIDFEPSHVIYTYRQSEDGPVKTRKVSIEQQGN